MLRTGPRPPGQPHRPPLRLKGQPQWREVPTPRPTGQDDLLWIGDPGAGTRQPPSRPRLRPIVYAETHGAPVLTDLRHETVPARAGKDQIRVHGHDRPLIRSRWDAHRPAQFQVALDPGDLLPILVLDPHDEVMAAIGLAPGHRDRDPHTEVRDRRRPPGRDRPPPIAPAGAGEGEEALPRLGGVRRPP